MHTNKPVPLLVSNPRSRLIETAVRPLGGDAEMKHAAVEMLGVLVVPEAQGAEEAIARWETVDARKNKTFWRRLLFSLFLIISAGIWADGMRSSITTSSLAIP